LSHYLRERESKEREQWKKESEILTSLKQKYRKTGNLNAGVTRTDKSTLKNAIEHQFSEYFTCVHFTHYGITLFPTHGSKVRVRHI
jgi:hypothetical protein